MHLRNLAHAAAATAMILGMHSGVSAQTTRPAPTQAANQPMRQLLTPANSVLLLIDHQPQMGFAVQSHDRQLLINNVTGLAKAAQALRVPAVLTTVAAGSFSGPIFPEIAAVFPGVQPFDRSSMNAWDDARVRSAVAATGRPKLVVAGLWTEVCVVMPVLDALAAGYEVYVVADASGGTSQEAHDLAMMRMVQAGAIPVTWQQVMLEWQRDWARQETAARVGEIVLQHSGAYGMGANYSRATRATTEAEPRP